MQRREFITAAVGMAAAVASASQTFAQDYPDVGAIKKMPPVPSPSLCQVIHY
jgi:hypothetical protein